MASAIQSWTRPTTTVSKSASECWRESLCFWPQFNFLVSYEAIIGLHVGYAALVYALVRFMKDRPAFELRTPMLVYNFAQIVISMCMTVGLAPYLYNAATGQALFNISGKFEHDIEFWVLAHYAAKYLDMFDTIFIVLRKKDKQFSFLHVYHHATIGVIWGGLLHWGVANGTAFFGAWINSLVHAIMYAHYFFSSLGFENPLKAYLTMFQMFQFGLCILHAVLVVALDTEFPTKVSLIQAAYHPTLLYLFNDYLATERAEKRKAAEAARLLQQSGGVAPKAAPAAVAAAAASPSTSRDASAEPVAAARPRKASTASRTSSSSSNKKTK